MLHILHQEINNIVNIHGIAENTDGSYRIDYIDNPSLEQSAQIEKIIDNWPLQKAKILKLEELDSFWKSRIAEGWISPYGWKLGLDTSDIALLNGVFTLTKEATSLGLSSIASIVDTDGLSHEISLNDLTILMVQYGQARAALSSEYSQKSNRIKSALSIDELNEILV